MSQIKTRKCKEGTFMTLSFSYPGLKNMLEKIS